MSKAPYASLNLALHVGDDANAVYENRLRALKALGMAPYMNALINPTQVHADTIYSVPDLVKATALQSSPLKDENNAAVAQTSLVADAVFCSSAFVPVLLCFADCVPVVLVSPSGHFCVVHAGRKGAFLGIVGKALDHVVQADGIIAAKVNVYIGPHICANCYEVPATMVADFCARYGQACDAGENRLSLEEAIKSDLLQRGCVEERIISSGICTTQTTQRYYSYRKEDKICGRHAAIACSFL